MALYRVFVVAILFLFTCMLRVKSTELMIQNMCVAVAAFIAPTWLIVHNCRIAAMRLCKKYKMENEFGKVNFLPHGFQLENYVKVFQLNGLGTAAMVSLGRTVIGTICTVLASVYLGFMFTQQRMWHRKLWYRFMVITMYFNAGLIPMYMTMKTLHLTNSFWVYIIPAIVQPFNIIMAKTYVESIPPALQEAAEIDGAGTMTVFAKVILPTCKPIMATIAIWSAVGQWNSFQDTLIYITDQKLYSLQYLLYT